MTFRYIFLIVLMCSFSETANTAAASSSSSESWTWHEPAANERHGKGWEETAAPFDRLPAHAEAMVRSAVWDLSRDSSGIYVEFATDAVSIQARWSLTQERLGLWHMSPSGASGLDFYVRDEGRWRWTGVGRATDFPDNESVLVRNSQGDRRQYRLYLPLYNGVTALEIGVPEDAQFEFSPVPETPRPVVVYGTSITQGACASRPGMAYPAILGRSLDWPVINLGFSGNGQTEPELAELLTELEPAAYVIDSLPNVAPEEVQSKIEEFVRILRETHKGVPIVLVENVTYTNAHIDDRRKARAEGSNEALRKAHSNLSADLGNLHYVESGKLFGDDGEDTVDGVHPTDIGMSRIAAGIEPVLRQALDLN